MIHSTNPVRRVDLDRSNRGFSSTHSLSQVESSRFQRQLAMAEPSSFPAVVQQQIALLGSMNSLTESKDQKATVQSAIASTRTLDSVPKQPSISGDSTLKLAALMPEEQLNKMSDGEIKALFQKTQDTELKSQLGVEAGIRRKAGGTTPAQPSSDQAKPNTATPPTTPAPPKIGVVVSLDDMNGDVEPVLESLKRLNIPVDLMPLNPKFMEGSPAQIASNLALITESLQKAKELGLNSRQGVHGDKAGVLDTELLPDTTTSAAAWPYAIRDKEAASNNRYLTPNTVIRGSGCVVNNWGEFDQHNLKSCSISNRSSDQRSLGNAADAVIQNGGVLSMHLHTKEGLAAFEATVKRLQAAGADFMFLEELKGKGAPVKK
ncbi:MAG: hypothetical protein ACH34X_13245 [Thiolinea sp.]